MAEDYADKVMAALARHGFSFDATTEAGIEVIVRVNSAYPSPVSEAPLDEVEHWWLRPDRDSPERVRLAFFGPEPWRDEIVARVDKVNAELRSLPDPSPRGYMSECTCEVIDGTTHYCGRTDACIEAEQEEYEARHEECIDPSCACRRNRYAEHEPADVDDLQFEAWKEERVFGTQGEEPPDWYWEADRG